MLLAAKGNDTLLVAGGPAAEGRNQDRHFVVWLRLLAGRVRRVGSICTGAFVLGSAGILDGHCVTTHWAFGDELARRFPNARVEQDPVFNRDRRVYTSAGISAGIDLAVALVEEDYGRHKALEIARWLVMFLVRPGRQAQFSRALAAQVHSGHPLRELQVWIMEHLKTRFTVEALGDRMGMSARHLSRVCWREFGMSPARMVELLRVEAAQRITKESHHGLKQIADRCGFGSVDSMRRSFLRTVGVTPAEYHQRFRRESSVERPGTRGR